MTNLGDGLDAEVGAAVDGDRQAIERLLASIRPLVVRYCRARVGRQERSFASADDVAQEVCLAVLTALPSYRDQGRPFLAFVYGIAAHKVADAHRSAARNRLSPFPKFPTRRRPKLVRSSGRCRANSPTGWRSCCASCRRSSGRSCC